MRELLLARDRPQLRVAPVSLARRRRARASSLATRAMITKSRHRVVSRDRTSGRSQRWANVACAMVDRSRQRVPVNGRVARDIFARRDEGASVRREKRVRTKTKAKR